MSIETIDLAQRLIRCPSVTPKDAGALDVLHTLLSDAGFHCTWADRAGIRNLLARWGAKAPSRQLNQGFPPQGRE